MNELLLGVDVGTTMTKAAVVSPEGQELSWGRVPTPWRPVATGAEAEPAEILGAVLSASAMALDAAPPGPVIGLGITSMAETAVVLGKDGRPVAACIAWHDRRGDEEAADLVRALGSSVFSEKTGLSPTAMCTLVKLAWLLRHRRAPVHRVLTVADWVVHALGGEQAAEASLASRTGALCVATRTWWDEGLEWAGLGPASFPPVAQAGQPLGRVNMAHTRRWPDRLDGAALASAGHDHLCVAAGEGATSTSQILDSCGTAEALVRTAGPFDEAGVRRAGEAGIHVSCHTVPGRHALIMGHSLGLLLERVLRLLGVSSREARDTLDRSALGVPAGGLQVVQAHRYASPDIVGLHADVSPQALWSAALDAVAARTETAIGTMTAFAGPAEELVLSGGWAHCAGLRQRKLTLLPRARWPAVVEAGARGAALFGGCAAGLFSGPANFPAAPEQPIATPHRATEAAG